jgi:putative redox protein
MKNKKVKFKNSQGLELAAKLEFPDGDIKAYAVFAHCFTCNKNLSAVRNIGRALNNCGIAVLRFDFTGLGESEGEFEHTNFSSNVEDLIFASQFLKDHYQAPSILIGHSLGGAAVIFAAKQIDSIKAVATIGAPSSPKHVSHLFKQGLEEINDKGEALLEIGGREFKIQKHFLNDINEKNMTETVRSLRLPLLVLHSPQDTTVGVENAAQIFKNAWHPKSFISLDGADHLLSKKEDSIYVGKMISNWVERYIN